MINLVKIYNLNRDDGDTAFINIDLISSIKEKGYGNTYIISMNNGDLYETDNLSFMGIMEKVY